MTTPTSPSKRFYVCGAAQASEWGSPVALGAGDGLFVSSDGNPAKKQAYEQTDHLGAVMPQDGDLGVSDPIDWAPEFGSKCGLPYEMGALGSLIAGLFGSTGLPDPLFVVDASNNKIDFKEGAGDPTVATVASGSYTATTLAAAIKSALDDAGDLTYTVTFSSTTKKFTIAATGEFSLLWNTGTNKAVDISTMCGYSDAADDTGTTSYEADSVAVGVAYTHTFAWADEMTDFFTFASERPGVIWEIPSCVPTKLSLKSGAGKIQGSIALRGNTLLQDSSTNTATEMDEVTPASITNLIKFQTGILQMNAQAGDALDMDDSVEVSEFENNYERNVDAQVSMGGSYISHPKESNFQIGLKIKLTYADGTNVSGYMTIFEDMAAQKLDITFTGPTIAGTHQYKLVISFPRLKLVVPPDVKLEDIIRNGLEFLAEEAAVAPSGMIDTRPYWQLTNTRAAAYVS